MPLDNPNEKFENPIPAAVRRASKRADAVARELGATNVPEDDTQPTEEVPPVETSPVEEPPPVENPPTPAVDWEQKWRTSEGRLGSQAEEIRGLRQQLASMQRLIADMQHQPPAGDTTTTVVDIPPEDREAFGEDLIAASQRWAAAKFQPEIDTLKAEIAQLRGGQQQNATQLAHERVHSALDADPELANWRQINVDPVFIAWLEEQDPFSGEQRVRLLGQAYSRGDAARCARFFKSFIAEHSAISPPATPPVPSAELPAADRPSLESLAAPGRAAGSGPQGGAPAEKRVWTRAEITAFYRDCAAGRYAHREAERGRIEADIFAANSQGRIR